MDWNVFATALGFFVVGVWNAWLHQRQSRQTATAATGVETVVKQQTRQQTGELTDKLDKIEETTHTLANGNVERRLRVIVAQAKRIANLTGDEEDRQAAADAQRELETHVAYHAKS